MTAMECKFQRRKLNIGEGKIEFERDSQTQTRVTEDSLGKTHHYFQILVGRQKLVARRILTSEAICVNSLSVLWCPAQIQLER
jgi:hypothetical protein